MQLNPFSWSRCLNARPAVAAFMAFMLLGCGGDSTTQPPLAPVVIDIQPSNVSIGVGGASQLIVTASRGGIAVPTESFTFKSSNIGVAVVTASGIVLGVSAGSSTITVTGSSGTSATVAATVTVPPPSVIEKTAGDAQTAFAGTAVFTPPSVTVKNFLGQPVAGVTVTFAVLSGGGSVTGATQVTNASGVATVGSWVIGQGFNSLSVTSGSLPQVLFAAIGLLRPGAIGLSASAVNFTGAVGGANPTAQTVTVSAQNGVLGQVSLGPITYGAGATDWLTATLSSPSAPANIVLTPSTAALPIGTYTASVPVLGSAATNSPQNIDVTLTVVATLPNSGIVLDIGAAATANVASGANISIPVIVDMTASSGGLRSLTFAFTWDPTLFDYNSSATGTFGTAPNFFVNTAGSATGSINFSVLDNTGLTSTSGSPTIFTVTLTAKNSSAGTNVTANVTAAGDATGQPLPAGVLTVRPLTVTIP